MDHAKPAAQDTSDTLTRLRCEIDGLNSELVSLLSRRAQIALEIAGRKRAVGRPVHDPERELVMMASTLDRNPGPFSNEVVAHLLNEVVKATVALMNGEERSTLTVARTQNSKDTIVTVKGVDVGAEPVLIAGPCSVEGEVQVEQSARFLASRGVRLMRGGAFKPRTSPYEFQGLGRRGLELLSCAARRHGLGVVTEIVDPRHVELVSAHADLLQVGARNMQNFELLKALGSAGRPVLLKRGLAATLDELLHAAEYVASHGNTRLVLCERGIRTFERSTRNTLDVSAVPLLRRMTHLPVLVDVSHAAGRRDILADLARAALASGAHGLMVEVHPCPAVARSDAQQQLDFAEFDDLLSTLRRPMPGLRLDTCPSLAAPADWRMKGP